MSVAVTKSSTRPWRGTRPTVGIFLATAILFVIGGIFVPQSVSSGAIYGMLPFASILVIVSLGQTLVIQQAGIDLSAPGIVSLSAVLVCYGYANDPIGLGSVAPYLVAAMVTAACAGFISGCLVTKLAIAPIVATLGMNALLYGLNMFISSGVPVPAPPSLTAFANGATFGINHLAYCALILALLANFVVKATVFGRTFEAVGASLRAARAAGIEADRYQISAYVGAAALYAIAGILLGSLMQTPSTQQGDSYLMLSIAATVLGGTSLFGGRGNLIATVVAAVFLTQLQQLVLTTGASLAVQYLFQGATILLGVAVYGTNLGAVVRHFKLRSTSARQDALS
ncbi:ABC transporter permease [Aminobacter sp. MSH1]|uniref:ABC transporter permease n=1 Tax=Aminobacter sp. MSH1 TaxID=374606 RepID=UPI000D3DBB1E|nr:ABC transporter permease [Aminobacter sp. MSH1]